MFDVNHNLHTAIFQEHIILRDMIGHIHHISESGATGPLDAKAQTDAFATLCYVCRDLPAADSVNVIDMVIPYAPDCFICKLVAEPN